MQESSPSETRSVLSAREQTGEPRPRLLLVSFTPFYGGGEVYLAKLARLLRHDYEMRAIVGTPELAAALRESNIPCEMPAPGGTLCLRYLATAVRLWRACREWHPHLVHLNGQGETHVAFVPSVLQIPVVSIRHTLFGKPHVSKNKRRLLQLEYRMVEAIVCVSKVVRDELAASISPAKLHVIPNWIETSESPRSPTRRPREGVFRLLVVSRLDSSKGVLDVIEAMRTLSNASLDIVGIGPQREELEKAASGLPIRFHGFQSDCGPFYEMADLLIFPSHAEGQGLVPLEAMARGLPCLLSDIPAAIETTDNGTFARIYRCGDPVDLARQVEMLRADQQRLAALSAAGPIRVHHAYSAPVVLDSYLRLYASLRRPGTASKEGNP